MEDTSFEEMFRYSYSAGGSYWHPRDVHDLSGYGFAAKENGKSVLIFIRPDGQIELVREGSLLWECLSQFTWVEVNVN